MTPSIHSDSYSEDEVPELEDMSHELQLSQTNGKKHTQTFKHLTTATSASPAPSPSSLTPASTPASSTHNSNLLKTDRVKEAADHSLTDTALQTEQPNSSLHRTFKAGFLNNNNKNTNTTKTDKQLSNQKSKEADTNHDTSYTEALKNLSSTTQPSPHDDNDISSSLSSSSACSILHNKSSSIIQQQYTSSLLSKLQHNKKYTHLYTQLQQPEIPKIFIEFQHNPTEALKKYQDREEVGKVIYEFMKLMGEEMREMKESEKENSVTKNDQDTKRKKDVNHLKPQNVSQANSSANNSNNDDTIDFNGRRVSKQQVSLWMSHPQIRYVLNDPMTSELLNKLQADPSLYPSYSQRPPIKLLITAGILQVPPQYRL